MKGYQFTYQPQEKETTYSATHEFQRKDFHWGRNGERKKTVKQLPTAVLVAEKNLWVTASHSENAYSLNQNLVLNNYYIKIY